jgi:glycosyltransferase involved in cell wall biosynthesis
MNEPVVSVILPVYNGENYVRLAIQSVLDQTLTDLELIVVDDGSTDSTANIVFDFGNRVRYVRQENTGVAGAFNHGLQLAKGSYISWLSHDDIFNPTKLEMQVQTLSRVTSPAVSYTDIQMINGSGEVVVEHRLPRYEPWEALRHIVTGGQICSACYSLMYDRRCIDAVGPYTEGLKYAQDVDMLSRLARRFPLIHVPEFLMKVREHQTRAIHTKGWQREIPTFFHERLRSISFEELFPERTAGSKEEKSTGYRWLGDTMAAQPYPISTVAFSQYRRALREDPSAAYVLLRRMARLVWFNSKARFSRSKT